MAATLKRIQHLFRRGDVVVLEASDPETGEVEKVPVYVQKLSALEKDEAVKDGRAAKARRQLAFDRDEDEQVTLTAMLGNMTDDQVVEDLMHRASGELYLKAEDEVRADKKWAERLEAIDRAETAEDGKVPESEQDLITALVREFQEEVERGHQSHLRSLRRELKGERRDALEVRYRKEWREMLGATAFVEARRQSEIWYALRECEVHVGADGEPDLATLQVGDRVCPTRAAVNDLPDEIIARVIEALDREMTPREAGNSDAPSASSGSSERPSAAEASRPSTPTAT